MTLVQYLLNGTSGQPVNVSGITGASVTTSGTGTCVYSASDAREGATGARVTTGTSTTTGAVLRLPFAATSSPNAAVSFWANLPASPSTGGFTFWSPRDTSGYSYNLIWDGQGTGVSGGGRLAVKDTAGNYLYPLGSTATQIAAGWYRFDIEFTNAVSGATMSIQLYNSSGTQVLTWSTSALVGRAVNWVSADYGVVSVVSSTSIAFDTIQMNDGSTTEIAPYTPTSTAPPTAAATVTTGIAVINAAAGSAPQNGGTLAYAISPTTNVTQIAPGIWQATRPAVGAADQAYTVTVTETTGTGSTSATTNVTVTALGTTATTVTPYTGTTIDLALPVPLDPGTNNTWGPTVNTALTGLRDALNGLITYYNNA